MLFQPIAIAIIGAIFFVTGMAGRPETSPSSSIQVIGGAVLVVGGIAGAIWALVS